ncbi:GreA/GreB family elongation factor [Mycolicibacterium celeriflavum]|uniref:GreA/GreB family elongation factor n=1 Tax=Mycolicibacterium celeriflavum TaxID=1249101 RepID=UPI0009EED1AE|nr:GreA/GreB family elongation factor [Mycolicibacterium celeriflavum]
MSSAQYVSMTRQAHTRLNNELAGLRSQPSIEVHDDFMDAAENRIGYRARRARIRQIEDLLAEVSVDAELPDDGIAEPGMICTVRYDTGASETFLLGGHGAGDDDNKIYPLRSPLGRAVAGARPGEHRTSPLPGGATIAVTLLNAQPTATPASARGRSQSDSSEAAAPTGATRRQRVGERRTLPHGSGCDGRRSSVVDRMHPPDRVEPMHASDTNSMTLQSSDRHPPAGA